MIEWEKLYSLSSRVVKELEIGRLFKVIDDPEIISFAAGMPDPSLFPVDEVRESMEDVFSSMDVWRYFQYGATEGLNLLIDFVVQFYKSREGLNVSHEQVIVTAGAQQGMDIVGKLLIDSGDEIAVESPTYSGAISSFRPYRPVFLTVPMERDGIDVDHLERLLVRGRSPKFVYTIPNFQNPSGITMSAEKRRRLVELSYRYGFSIIEDDPYGELRFRGERIPSLLSMDVEGGHVIRLGSFSKIFAPGIRIGWIVVPREVVEKIIAFKQGMDLSTSALVQAILHTYLKKVSISEHIHKIATKYGRKMAVMKSAIDEYIPEVEYVEPDGGMFFWLTLSDIEIRRLFDVSIKNKVAFTPGDGFYPYYGGHHSMRLCFSFPTEEDIVEGIKRIGKSVKELRG